MTNTTLTLADESASTRLLLLLGAIAGPLFILTVLVQDYTRAGFDQRLDMLSLLALGSFGWIQMANFITTGILDVLYSVGLRRSLRRGKSGTWAPIFIGVHGFWLVWVGIFRTDPANGFPPGVVPVTPPTWHGILHALGAPFAFLSLAAGILAFGRLFLSRRNSGWALYCFASAMAMVVIFFVGFTQPTLVARTLRLAVLIGWSAASIVAMRLLSEAPTLS
jgi:hypothetical membrane protein